MSEIEIKQMQEKINAGILLARKRLIEKVKKEINLLVLALGLSYLPDSADESFFLDESTVNPISHFSSDKEKYFYYDIQDAVYK